MTKDLKARIDGEVTRPGGVIVDLDGMIHRERRRRGLLVGGSVAGVVAGVLGIALVATALGPGTGETDVPAGPSIRDDHQTDLGVDDRGPHWEVLDFGMPPYPSIDDYTSAFWNTFDANHPDIEIDWRIREGDEDDGEGEGDENDDGDDNARPHWGEPVFTPINQVFMDESGAETDQRVVYELIQVRGEPNVAMHAGPVQIRTDGIYEEFEANAYGPGTYALDDVDLLRCGFYDTEYWVEECTVSEADAPSGETYYVVEREKNFLEMNAIAERTLQVILVRDDGSAVTFSATIHDEVGWSEKPDADAHVGDKTTRLDADDMLALLEALPTTPIE